MYRPPPRPEPKNPFFAIFASIGIFAGIFIFIYLIGQCVEKIQEYLNKKPESSSSTASNSEGKGVDSRVKKDQQFVFQYIHTYIYCREKRIN